MHQIGSVPVAFGLVRTRPCIDGTVRLDGAETSSSYAAARCAAVLATGGPPCVPIAECAGRLLIVATISCDPLAGESRIVLASLPLNGWSRSSTAPPAHCSVY